VWLLSLAIPAFSGAAEAAADVQVLDASGPIPAVTSVVSGALDAKFHRFEPAELSRHPGPWWLRIGPLDREAQGAGIPVLSVRASRSLRVQVFESSHPGSPVNAVIEYPDFIGREAIFPLPDAAQAANEFWYARVDVVGPSGRHLRVTRSTLEEAVTTGERHGRMIAFAFGGLIAMAVATLLIWFVLSDKLFVLYSALTALEALYLAYFSGQAFYWPILSAAPFAPQVANVAGALSGAIACLFIREIADLRHSSQRMYAGLGWFAVAFVVVAISNIARAFGLGLIVMIVGNLVFLGSALFALPVCFLAWRRGNRAAGWFLVAWGLLEVSTIATSGYLLIHQTDLADWILYYSLPFSMVAAAVLIALGVADRLRDQRRALSDAQRRAQTDPLTGVLNRGSLIERLHAACLRAQARGLPVAVLFIDLDHFKEINDTFGHAAGDACLSAIIPPIQAELRQSDVIGRYGGEEFVVILSSADRAAAHPIAERIRARVADVSVEGFGKPIRLTCSIGVACSDTLGVWGENLIAHADAAVYGAKRSGRNRVQMAISLAA
jgi:diguanylate cyclase (GGDEF)-like protein